MKLMCVAGARPNFMKIAPILAELGRRSDAEALLVHTGQHYDKRMSDLFFSQLGIPQPHINLEVGSASHAVQTADIMKSFEPVLLAHGADAVIVVGDVNSTIACGLVAAKLGVKLAHVEAGLRSFDRSMPEEINRLLTDSISDFLFCTEESGVENLRHEGVSEEKIFYVGNVMIDTLLANLEAAQRSNILATLGLDASAYAVLTLHRPSNVDNSQDFSRILDALDVIQMEIPVVFPVHPRTRRKLESSELGKRLRSMKNIRLLDPAAYLDFLKLLAEAKIVLTDSGGIQEETTILKVPCITLRENTERPVTLEMGGNRLAGSDPDKIVAAYREMTSGQHAIGTPPLWDGGAAHRIVQILEQNL